MAVLVAGLAVVGLACALGWEARCAWGLPGAHRLVTFAVSAGAGVAAAAGFARLRMRAMQARVRALAADLRRNEDRYRETVDSLRQVIFRMDARGRWVFLNAAWTELTGYPVSESLGTCFLDYVHPGDRRRHAELFQPRSAGAGTYVAQEVRYVTRAGSVRWVEVWGRVVRADGGAVAGVFGTLMDITERRRAEEDRALLTSAVEQAAESIMITNSRGAIVYVNPAFQRLTGYTAEEVVGRTPRLLTSDRHSPELFREIRDVVLGGQVWRGELVNRRKDGSLYVEELSVAPVRDSRGTITHFVTIGQDITARQQMEQQLRQAQKMDAVGRLAGGVAHDFNNVLTVITGRCELLLRRLEQGSPTRRDVELMLEAARRASALTRQLLAFSRMQKLELRVLDINEVVRGMEKLLRRLIGEDVELVLQLAPALGRVRADRGQLEQVVMNLVVNAREAMPRGGRITLTTNGMDRWPDGSERAAVVLAVDDTGIGMDAATRARIFEPFFTTKRERGTGLGLATVYGIVKQSGGEIVVESEPGQGTTFRIYLPRVEAEPDPDEEVAEEPVPGGTETILLVEDEAEVRRLARDILREHGYAVHEAADGEEGLRRARDAAFDLLVTDVVLPRVGGVELARRLSAVRPGLRVLYMSGYTEDDMTFRSLAAREVPFLSKPFSPASLLRAVRQALDGTRPAPLEGPRSGHPDPAEARLDAPPEPREPRGGSWTP
ncbi:MAG: PAS domain S-box protein [Armatimonadota bacterium]|nr:PAS domain S-box protein [Armatimonadota bacterium]MDR7553963.1 PAS domain S-box protein [Armatimonadota bacterium]